MNDPSDHSERADASASPAWPITNQLPANSAVRLIFAGLMGLCYKSSGICEVGFYSKDGKHQPKIVVYEKPGCNPDQRPIGAGRMTIGITTSVLLLS